MPHKRNPFISQQVISLAKKIKHNAALVTEFMMIEHEHNLCWLTGALKASRDACLSIGRLLTHGENMAGNMTANPRRMKANLGTLKRLMESEAVMLELGRNIGRQAVHELVYEDAQRAM
jgi:adenylosuccinate lyase